MLSEYMEIVPFIPVSSKLSENFEEVYYYLHQIYRGGEDFEKEELEE